MLLRLSRLTSNIAFRQPLRIYSQKYTTSNPISMANRAAFLETEKGQFVVRDAETWQPGPGEVLIKVHAAAIQPADAKIAKLAVLKMEYPSVLGSPVAGTVEALGEGTSRFAIGDRICCGTKVFVHKKTKYGGLQRFSVVDESEIVEVRPLFHHQSPRQFHIYRPDRLCRAGQGH